MIENRETNPLKSIYQGCLTVFIRWIVQTTKGEGSGIGLAIVKSIIGSLHHGMQVESDVHSTRFILSVPRLEKMIPGAVLRINLMTKMSLACHAANEAIWYSGAAYQEGWIALSISGVGGRGNEYPDPRRNKHFEPVSVMELAPVAPRTSLIKKWRVIAKISA